MADNDDNDAADVRTMLLRVGDRVEEAGDDGTTGTVRYVGPVATSKDATAVYYGIEWDDWGRGLNDGSVVLPSGERVVYFVGPAGRKPAAVLSPHSPTTPHQLAFKCSFVKASKFRVKPPRTLVERLLERYHRSDALGSSAAAVPPPQFHARATTAAPDVITAGAVGTTLGSHKPIELVGVEKLKTQQTLATVEKVTLARLQIATLGTADAGELGALTPSIRALDLSRNLFSSWTAVLRVVRELPALETLILSGNRLAYDVSLDTASSDGDGDGSSEAPSSWQFPNVTTLVLNETFVAWPDLLTLLTRHFPRVVELHVVGNSVSDADLALLTTLSNEQRPSWTQTLEVLDLNQNQLRSWPNVLATLGRTLVNLQHLVVNNNEIATLVADTASPRAFEQLRALSISDNRIDSWTSIDALNAFPQLDTLRFTRNPVVTQMGPGEVRMVVIARCGGITSINGSGVRAKERHDAEHMYLKRILHELAAVGDDDSADARRVRASHPRFAWLSERYPDTVATFSFASTGASTGSGGNGSTAGPTALATSLIRVKIVPMSMQATSFEPLEKRVPEKMKVAQLKLFVEKKFGVDAQSQVLSFRPDARSMSCPLDDDNSEIGYYGLQDGAEILVNDA